MPHPSIAMSAVVTLPQPGALARKLESRSARVAVVGLGDIGLPLIHAFWKSGSETIGIDSDLEKIAMLVCSESYVEDFGAAAIEEMHKSGRFYVTPNASRLAEADVIVMCAPQTSRTDPRTLMTTAETVSKHLRRQMLVVLEAAAYPGSTLEIVLPILERSGLKAGRDFYLAFSAETGDGDDVANGVLRIVGGIDEPSSRLAGTLYELAFDKVQRDRRAVSAEAAG